MDTLSASIALFVGAAVIIALAGSRMSRLADRLADCTGLGEALFGGIILAAATSLPDLAATVTAAVQDRPALATSNIMGSMAANIAFLAVGDMLYRRANLEHAAASPANLSLSALSIALITLPVMAMIGPPIEVWIVHPATFAILLAYPYGYHLVRLAHTKPMWKAVHTAQTVEDVPKADAQAANSTTLWVRFASLALVVAVAAWVIMNAAGTIADHTALSDSVVGALLTGVFTSLPELVTTIAAIRAGALTLAFGNIVGTNCFNVVVIAFADLAYVEGSIYQAVTTSEVLWGLLSILMMSILLLGLVRRQRYGIGRIGFESALVLLLWLAAAAASLATL